MARLKKILQSPDTFKYYAIDGIDGCGKSYLISLLYQQYKKTAKPVLIKEPFAMKVSKDTTVEEYIKDRIELQSFLLPHLRENKTVISDRCLFSTLIYQSKCKVESFDILSRHSTFVWPSEIFVLICDYETAKKNIISRQYNTEFLTNEKIQDHYDANVALYINRIPNAINEYAEYCATNNIKSSITTYNVESRKMITVRNCILSKIAEKKELNQ